MPQFQSYPEETTVSNSDKVLFYKASSNALRTITFANLYTQIKNAIASFFTSSAVVPSTVPSAGQILVGDGSAFAPKTVSGDITLTSGGVATIANDSVTFAKMQNISAGSRLIGSSSSGGGASPTEITLGTGLSMSGSTLNASAGTGNVTQSSNASAADHLFVSGGADKSRVETPVTIDPTTGDVDTHGGDLDVDEIVSNELDIDSTHATDDTFHGIVISSLLAGASISQWSPVFLNSSSRWVAADADYYGSNPARGLAVAAYSNNDSAKVLIIGTVRNDAWNWTPGGDIYLSDTAGDLTQVAPVDSGDIVQKVGFALTADTAFFNFGSNETLTVE